MVLADFFNLTDAQYALRIKAYPDSQLLEQLKVKNMQVKVGRVVKATGAVLSFVGDIWGDATGDDIIVPVVLGSMSQLGNRRVVVSRQKIRLIEAELARRGHGKRELDKTVEGPPAYGEVMVCDVVDDGMGKPATIIEETVTYDAFKTKTGYESVPIAIGVPRTESSTLKGSESACIYGLDQRVQLVCWTMVVFVMLIAAWNWIGVFDTLSNVVNVLRSSMKERNMSEHRI